MSDLLSEAPRPSRQDGTGTPGLPRARSGEREASKGNIVLIVPLDPAYKAGLAGYLPAIQKLSLVDIDPSAFLVISLL
jgi:hypothetical protein